MDTERRGWSRRGLVAAAAVATLLTAGALALALGDSGSGTATGSAVAAGPVGTVERRTLAERLTATGQIGYAAPATVLARLSGTVTALPAIGETVRRGERLYTLNDEPVLLMYGTVPAYRDLSAGVGEGEDVEQLEDNLAALGYEPGSVDGEFTSSTAAAVSAWQEDVGLEASGEVELGRVAFLGGPQRVAALDATLGEALGGGSGGSESEGDAESPSSPVLRTSSTRRIVAVELKADQQAIARPGQRVEVVLPGGAGVPGAVRRLAAVELSGSGSGSGEEAEAGVEATISVTGRHGIPALDGVTVSVLFTDRVRKDVLSAPLTALLAIGADRFAVVAVDGARRQRIEVTPGLAADGFVEVEGRGLREGMRVEVGE